jgi:hypothetical protein
VWIRKPPAHTGSNESWAYQPKLLRRRGLAWEM